jgi:predicted nucleic acid-binding protein
MAIVVDTNVVSYIFKKDTRNESYKPHLIQVPKFISFMTFAELRRWKIQSNWGKSKNEKFEELLSEFGVIHSDEKLCEIWAEITSHSRKKGKSVSVSDAWIAAVALMFDIPPVTHNRKHFEHISGLQIISEK